MTPQAAIDSLQQALLTAFWLSLPLLAIGFIVGIAISLLQVLTSIQDPAFGALPRLAAFLAGLFLFLPWMLTKGMTYAAAIFGNLGRYAR